jgi:hypothetical protein
LRNLFMSVSPLEAVVLREVRQLEAGQGTGM